MYISRFCSVQIHRSFMLLHGKRYKSLSYAYDHMFRGERDTRGSTFNATFNFKSNINAAQESAELSRSGFQAPNETVRLKPDCDACQEGSNYLQTISVLTSVLIRAKCGPQAPALRAKLCWPCWWPLAWKRPPEHKTQYVDWWRPVSTD